MNFLIFSDSHGATEAFRAVLSRQVIPPDGVIFLGDGLRDFDAIDLPAAVSRYAVRGNCDWFGAEKVPTDCVTSVCGHTLFLSHGHLFDVKYGFGGILSAGVTAGADLIFFGHTHLPYDETVPAGTIVDRRLLSRPVHLFNPGSLQRGSFGSLTLQNGEVLLSHGSL